ncbi:MAG: hypothetical protein DRG83_04385 [Deltaproteobacteria bacterium]|nr:MAG: hypothetical protein DRG83_04385 [Deltaproteobacteria bacterium]
MIVIIATLDTKGDKAKYLKDLIEGFKERLGRFEIKVIDCGVLGEPYFKPDISKNEVAEAAGTSIAELAQLGDEAQAVDIMAEGVSKILEQLHEQGRLEGVVGLGGTMGSCLFASATRSLPIGVPKVLLSTCLFSPHFPFGDLPSDVIVVPFVSDIHGLSSLSKLSLENAAGAIAGVLHLYRRRRKDIEGKFVALTTVGTSWLKPVQILKPHIENQGQEVAVFHIGGGQGKSYEEFVKEGLIKVSLDLCWLDVVPQSIKDPRFLKVENRLTSATEKGIPQILAPGLATVITFGGKIEELPEQFRGRKVRYHNKYALAVERSEEELEETAELVAERLNGAKAPVVLVLPQGGLHSYDENTKGLFCPQKREFFLKTLKKLLQPKIECVEFSGHVNDENFAKEVATIYEKLATNA